MNFYDIEFETFFDWSWFPSSYVSFENQGSFLASTTTDLKIDQAVSWLNSHPPAIEGKGGDSHTYSTCCVLVKAFCLSDKGALAAIERSGWNKRCLPPWTDEELLTKIENAKNYGQDSKFILPETNEWEPIIPLDEHNLPDFPTGIFPEPLEKYLSSVAMSSETPRALAMLLIFAVISTAVRGCYQIKINESYREPCPIWVLILLDPGNRKSYVVKTLFAVIYAFEKQLIESSQNEINRTNSKIRNCESQINALRKKLSKDNADTAKIIAEIEKIESEMPKKKYSPRVAVTDVTPEKLAIMMSENEEVISLLSDEGGLFETMGGRYNRGKSNFDLYLQAYSESAVRVDRVSSDKPVIMNNPILTIGATVQPAVLSALSNRPEFKNLGLLSRFIYAVPQSTIGFRGWENKSIPADLETYYKKLITEILEYTTYGGGNF